MAVSQVKLKLLMDTNSKKVLFAEAGKDFVDFLIYLLSLPISRVIELLKRKGGVGCLKDLYVSLGNLGDEYIQSGQTKTSMLHHKSSLCVYETPLLLSLDQHTGSANAKKRLKSKRMSSVCSVAISTPNCSSGSNGTCEEGGFVKGVVTYMVMDNLEVRPMSIISSITMLKKFNVQYVGALKEEEVVFGFDEAQKLLKASLESRNVLSTVYQKNVRG